MSDEYDTARFGVGHAANLTAMPPHFMFDGFDVRAFEMGGNPWFVAKDIAAVLGYANPRKAVRDHCKTARQVGGNGSFLLLDPQTIVIPERDVYRLVMRSKLPSAERFEDWVSGEVLPSIRKTGQYGNRAPASAPAINVRDHGQLAAVALQLIEFNKELETRAVEAEAQVAELEPKAAAHDRIAELRGTFSRTAAAKMLGVPPNVLMTWMSNNGWTYTRTGGTDTLAHQAKINAGLLENKIAEGRDGATWRRINVHVTPKGLTVLAKAFPPLLQIAGAA